MSSLRKAVAEKQKTFVEEDNETEDDVVHSEVVDDEEDEEDDDDNDNNDEEGLEEFEGGKIPIDLSENEVYRGICTLLEDEDGNNILEYISLLHTELIGINKSLENLRGIRKDIGRISDCAEAFLKTKKVADVSVQVPKVSSEEVPKKKKVVA
jgi:hypothetical protein